MWQRIYVVVAMQLLVFVRIHFATFRMALREWPVAVAGKQGSHVLDPEFPG
ncbi:hypothetical protein [Sphingopyxis panaciterrulae]|uniref:Uncharacterized protein n=1 Tax=Sphingopyxis panaciterrulae TaxID=462372 RepID=A0A7W9ER37_9SPHN|nr:hypothetical protein [Sphingopyxis panaciterrulae]MBB5707337.1 hypothetical protein [Sphingopyxis panaciterrulae]